MDLVGPFLLLDIVHAGLTPLMPSTSQPACKAWIMVIVVYFTKIAEFAGVEEHSLAASAAAADAH